MAHRDALLCAIAKAGAEGDFEELEELLQRHLTRGDEFDLKDVVDVLEKAQHESLWAALYSFSTALVQALHLDEEGEDEEEEAQMVEGGEEIVQSLRRVAAALQLYVDMPNGPRPPSLVSTLTCFHDLLIPLSDEIPGASAFKSTVARCCESWWVKDEPGAPNVVVQLVPYNLMSALGPSILDADVKRCWNIRGALLLLDFEDPSIDSIRGLLLRCVIHPGFLKVVEGRRFLSFIFSLNNTQLAQMMINVMKPQICTGGTHVKGVANAYGEVIYRAWKDAEEGSDLQSAIEECIQGLIHEAIHAAEGSYHRGLRFLLGQLHENKRVRGVDSLLLRVYGPILWRSLRCANPLVRAQATMLFFDAFPLQDSDASNVESDVVLQKQFGLLSSLLKDTDQRVRFAAVSGVFRVLSEYWEALPLATTTQILTYVIGTLGQDASCANVRLAVVRGLCDLVDQPLAHGVLAGLLPLLANSLHDTSEKVRIAFIAILDKVKTVKNIAFYEVAGEDHILARLAEDARRPAVATALTKLLLNSFYPREDNGSSSPQTNIQQKLRCLKFVRMNTAAAVAFYSNLHKFVSVGSATKLCAMLFAVLRQPVIVTDATVSAAGGGTASTSSTTEAEAVEDDGTGSSSSHPLAQRAKRRREKELAKRGVDDCDDNAPKEQIRAEESLDIATRVGLLRVILGCFSSIADKLKEDTHEPSRELLGRHMHAEAVLAVFKAVEPSDTNLDVESLPLLLRLVSILNDVNGDSIAQTLSFESVMASFTKAWSSISTDETLPAAVCSSKMQQQAVACVEVACALGNSDDLVKILVKAFKTLAPAEGGARKKTAVPMGAAVDLLVALCNSSAANSPASAIARGAMMEAFGSSLGKDEENNEEDALTRIFSLLQGAAADMSFSALSPTELLRCVHLNAQVVFDKAGVHEDDKPMKEFLRWVGSAVVPGICERQEVAAGAAFTPREFFQLALKLVLAAMSDCLVLRVAIDANLAAAEEWVGACNKVLKEEVGSSLPELIPFVSRICFAGFACKKDDESSLASTHSSAFSVLVEFLLLHLRPSSLPSDAPAAAAAGSSSNKFVQDLLNKSSNRSVAEMCVQFVVDHVKTSKKRSGAECLKWEDSNATANLTMDLLKAAPEFASQAAAMYLNASLTKGRPDKGHTLLLAELFASSGAKSKKEVLDSLGGDKENAKALTAALTRGEDDVMDV